MNSNNLMVNYKNSKKPTLGSYRCPHISFKMFRRLAFRSARPRARLLA